MQDPLGDRMRSYEDISRAYVTPRMPVVLRVDGRAFHSYFGKVEKPWSPLANEAMKAVALALFKEVAGAQCAFQQSDEISLLIHPYKRFTSQCWFGGNVQKIVSVAASVASTVMTEESVNVFGERRIATFDARCFVIPEADVQNYFLARQRDATRNSIQSFGKHLLGPKRMHGLNGPMVLDACQAEGHDWEAELPLEARQGSWVRRLVGDGTTLVEAAPRFSSVSLLFQDFISVEEQ